MQLVCLKYKRSRIFITLAQFEYLYQMEKFLDNKQNQAKKKKKGKPK